MSIRESIDGQAAKLAMPAGMERSFGRIGLFQLTGAVAQFGVHSTERVDRR